MYRTRKHVIPTTSSSTVTAFVCQAKNKERSQQVFPIYIPLAHQTLPSLLPTLSTTKALFHNRKRALAHPTIHWKQGAQSYIARTAMNTMTKKDTWNYYVLISWPVSGTHTHETKWTDGHIACKRNSSQYTVGWVADGTSVVLTETRDTCTTHTSAHSVFFTVLCLFFTYAHGVFFTVFILSLHKC